MVTTTRTTTTEPGLRSATEHKCNPSGQGGCISASGVALLDAMATIERHLTREVVGLDGSTSCREAARVMAEKRIGAVAVRDSGRTVGIVTERDLVYNVLASGGTCEFPIR